MGGCSPLIQLNSWGREALTLSVHSKGIKEARTPDLGPQQGYIQLHKSSLAVLSMQIQLTCADPPCTQSLGVTAPAIRLGQEAVDKVELGFLEGVNEGILDSRERDLVKGSGGEEFFISENSMQNTHTHPSTPAPQTHHLQLDLDAQ